MNYGRTLDPELIGSRKRSFAQATARAVMVTRRSDRVDAGCTAAEITGHGKPLHSKADRGIAFEVRALVSLHTDDSELYFVNKYE